ncbi:MAG: DUF4968 domain-containing protein [Clostridium sp.]|nr:DUF4968 domain-containing protein [Prevotella sp.]MCM1429101.1 DUF4968 domain-containing protein [Clostridium sp.]MCM1475370.1 DUF4968 domain-containing protein [Muribaculaceae bacterium]
MKLHYTLPKTAAVAAVLATLMGGAYASVHRGHIHGRQGSYEVATPAGRVAVDVLDADIIRVSTLPNDTSIDYAISQSASLEPGFANVHTMATDSSFVVATPSTILNINRNSGLITFRDSLGRVLLTENGGVDNRNRLKTVKLKDVASGRFYGAGERGHRLTLNGDSLSMYNRQNYGYTEGDPRLSQMGISVPWISSDAGYGILFDDYNQAALDLRGDSIVYTSLTDLPLSYYFVNGHGTLAGNTEGYTRLTGRQDLPPFWALGYITSKYGYHNREETLGAVDSLKTRGYPLDGIVLDLYWYGKETDMGRLEWNREQFPAHGAMLDSLKKLGVNTVLISQPYINKIGALDNYNLLDSLGMLTRDEKGATHDVTTWVGEAGMFDISNPATREWLWNRLKGLTAEGVAGWWGDLGEPEVHPLSIVHANGQTASEYHNVYGNEWSKTIYDGLRKDFPKMRPLLMMRGGTAGLQRYSVFPWTTDVSRSWGGLQPQVKLMISSGLSGLGYMGSDVGGFAVDPAHPYDPELYVRWMQAGVFSPMLRTHAQDRPEPYHYPKQQDITLELVKTRYRWLPYNYTLAYENASMGLPLARPLNFRGDNPEAKYTGVEDEYLWGDNVLVAPVMKQGARSRKVLFPKGEWYDFANPRLKYRGGTTATVQAPLEKLPLFVKAGSFIPQYMEAIANTGEYNPATLCVKYFPSSSETSYTLFDDDRKNPTSLEDNSYQLTRFTGFMSRKELDINIESTGLYPGMPAGRMLTIEVEDVKTQPKSVGCGDRTMEKAASVKAMQQSSWTYDKQTRRLTIVVPYDYQPTKITATF